MKIKSVFFEYIKGNKKTFFALLIFFFIGIGAGIVFINHANEKQVQEICLYVNSLKENIKSTKCINKTLLLMQSMKHNILFMLIIWLLGCTLIGSYLIYIAMFYKGFSISYTVSAIIATLGVKHGILFSILALLFQNLTFLPMMFILSESGIKLYKNLKKNRNYNIKLEFIRHTIIMLLALMFSVISSFIEVYVSTNFLIFFKKFL